MDNKKNPTIKEDDADSTPSSEDDKVVPLIKKAKLDEIAVDQEQEESDEYENDDGDYESSLRSSTQVLADIAALDNAIQELSDFDPTVNGAEEETFEGFEEAEEDNGDDEVDEELSTDDEELAP